MNIPSLIGPQIYGTPKTNKKCISVNIDLDFIRSNRFINFTGYAWADLKYKFVMTFLKNSWNKIIIHDSDYLGLDEYANVLIERGHTVCFVLSPKEWSIKDISSRQLTVFGGCPASNKRIRNAYNKLKALGVKVKKFQSPLALERYLIKARGE